MCIVRGAFKTSAARATGRYKAGGSPSRVGASAVCLVLCGLAVETAAQNTRYSTRCRAIARALLTSREAVTVMKLVGMSREKRLINRPKSDAKGMARGGLRLVLVPSGK